MSTVICSEIKVLGLVPQWLQEFEKEAHYNKQKVIYVSAPYSLGDVVSNVRFACEVGDKILAMGHIPFIPHLSHFWHFLSPKSYEEWLRIDQAFIPRCDALLRLDGISNGADKEVKRARELNIPVYYSIEELENGN